MGGSTNQRAARLSGLDAIRVVAVLAVLLYHADELVPGGLLGVTVFFVLSGFLITGQVWNGLERSGGRLDAKAFWSRRVRRLLPASLLVVAVIGFVWPMLGYELPVRDVLSAVLPVRNWALLRSSVGYGASPSPTAHFWSLAVEEQVYLLLPVVLLVLVRLRSRRRAGLVLAVFAGAAMAGGAALARAGQLDRAYLSTYTRAGEVLAGAAAALLWRTGVGRRASGVLAAAGVVALGAVFTIVSWPSADVSMVGIPVAVAATLALCGASLTAGTWWSGLGGTRVVRVVADHAYELYLVHVPIYAVVTQYRTGLAGTTLLAARLAATGVVAFAVHALVEPIRRHRFVVRPVSFVSGLAVLAALALAVPVAQWADRPQMASAAAATALPDLPGLTPATAAPAGGRGTSRPPTAAAHSVASVSTASAPATTAAPRLPRGSVWFVGDSTLRELDDPSMTMPTLSDSLATAGWHVSGGVALRALRICTATDWDGRVVGEQLVHLPAVRDVVREWWAIAPGDHVVVQLGANDLSNGEWDSAAMATCIGAMIDSLPSDVQILWVAPVLAEWCWCSSGEPRANVKDFVDILEATATTHPNLSVVVDGLSLRGSKDLRKLMAEDGIHATEAGRAVRVSAIVDQLGPVS